MGSGERSFRSFHLHLPHLHHPHHHHHQGHGGHYGKRQGGNRDRIRDVPKGCLAIRVGGKGEEPQRFVVPVAYFNHPLFLQLLKEAEEEYGFDHKGTITIPCQVRDFRFVQCIIDEERSSSSMHLHHHDVIGCFRV